MTRVKMKTKLSKELLRATDGHICKKTKFECSRPKFSFVTAELDKCTHNCLCDSSGTELLPGGVENEITDIFDEQNSQFPKQSADLDKSTERAIEESNRSCTPDLETIFSPFLESTITYGGPNIGVGQGCSELLSLLGVDDTIHNSNLYGEQACGISSFSIPGTIIASVPFDDNRGDCDNAEMAALSNHICHEQRTSFDAAGQCVMLPSLENKTSHKDEVRSPESCLVDRDGCGLYLIQPITPCDEKDVLISVPRDSEYFDPQFIKKMPELSDVVSNFLPAVLPKDEQKRKAVTLVLDLDETLVHSTLEQSNDGDFSFTVLFNMLEHTVYVKQRPHLFTFLERVAEIFEVVIFTASQRIYAAKLLDILDPDGKIISRRMYRESCIFSNGSYTKDLTVLGVDLAKVVIIDNSPQVFRLQVDNGIPIKSWFDDPCDDALISLLPFLETLVDADDVRPIIADQFGNKE